jgi:hypothetical protein
MRLLRKLLKKLLPMRMPLLTTHLKPLVMHLPLRVMPLLLLATHLPLLAKLLRLQTVLLLLKRQLQLQHSNLCMESGGSTEPPDFLIGLIWSPTRVVIRSASQHPRRPAFPSGSQLDPQNLR